MTNIRNERMREEKSGRTKRERNERSLRRFFFFCAFKVGTISKICAACHQISNSMTSFSTRNPISHYDYLKRGRGEERRELWNILRKINWKFLFEIRKFNLDWLQQSSQNCRKFLFFFFPPFSLCVCVFFFCLLLLLLTFK